MWILAVDLPLVVSLASAATAVTALALTVYQQFWRAPKLMLTLDLDPTRGDLITLAPVADPETTSDVRERDTTEHWVRLRVRNARRKHSAKKAEVLYIGCRSAGEVSIDPRPLRFTGTSENLDHSDILAMGADKPALTATIPPGVFRQVDLLAASVSHSVSPRLRGRPRLAVWPGPGIDLAEGSHDIYLVVAATDTDAVFYRVTIGIFPGWTDDAVEWWSTRVVLSPLERLTDREVKHLWS
jgi:hypothetical protein